jgi:catechol 2,3-dioxygenase-like lactoylglutathione lyase family enzyme
MALAVRDPERAARFYGQALGTVVVYRSAGFLQVQIPGSRDVRVFQTDPAAAGKAGGIAHFGFRLVSAEEIELAVEAVERAGGTILQRGEFGPWEPFVFFADPDGLRWRSGMSRRRRSTRADPRPDPTCRRANRRHRKSPVTRAFSVAGL